MPATYKDFMREPSKPHQCMHSSNETGIRCRATAMQNEYMCYVHRDDVIMTVIENDPFLIDRLDTRDDVQRALLAVASRLACNRIDLKRAGLLGFILQNALRNLAAAPNQTLNSAPLVPDHLEDGPGDPELLKLARPNLDDEDAPDLYAAADCQSIEDCHSERSERGPRPACWLGQEGEESPQIMIQSALAATIASAESATHTSLGRRPRLAAHRKYEG